MQNVSLLRDPRLFNKLCQKINRDFGCKDAHMCNVACPVWIFRETEYLMNSKGMTLGEAYRACLRAELTEKEKRAVIKDYMQEQKEYPTGDVKKALDNEQKDTKDRGERPRRKNRKSDYSDKKTKGKHLRELP